MRLPRRDDRCEDEQEFLLPRSVKSCREDEAHFA